MSHSTAERAGIVGVMLLSGGILAALLLFFLPGTRGRPAQSASHAGETPVTGTARAAVGTGAPAPSAPSLRAAPELKSRTDFVREINRLRKSLNEAHDRISVLEGRLRDAGVSLKEKPEDPSVAASSAIDDLRACGPETAPSDVDRIVDRIVSIGPGAVETVKHFLGQNSDVAFSDGWRYFGGRFTSWPTLRIALMGALRRIGHVEGESALTSLLREDTDPMEILVLIAFLSDVKRVESVDEVRTAAARKYLSMTPHPREMQFYPTLLDVFVAEPAKEAVRDLTAFATNPKRRAEVVHSAISRIDGLPPPIAIPALRDLVAGREGGAAAREAAADLAARPDRSVVPALTAALSTAAPKVRRIAYHALPDAMDAMLHRLDNSEHREGLAGEARLERIEAEIAARKALLDARAGAEKDVDLVSEIDAARRRIEDQTKRTAKIAKEIRGK